MITIYAFWGVLGLALGLLHAGGIWRAAASPRAASAVLGLLRLMVVALSLAGGAIFGGIVPIAIGWAVGFAIGIAIVLASWPRANQHKATS